MPLVFFATSLGSALYRGTTDAALIGFGVFMLVPALILLLRFGPERLHLHALTRTQPVVRFVRRYPWRILTVLFFLTSVGLIGLNFVSNGDPPSERIVFVVSLDDTSACIIGARGNQCNLDS